MTYSELSEFSSEYAALSNTDQLYFLARLAHTITIRVRASHIGEPETESTPSRLNALNEVQHQIAGQLTHMVRGDTNRYPDTVFAEILLKLAQTADCERDIVIVVERIRAGE